MSTSSRVGELVLQRARRLDLRRPFLGRGLADLLRRRVLTRPQLLDDRLSASRRAASASSTVVDQARRDALAFDAGAVLGFVAQASQVDHVSSSARIWSRSPPSHAFGVAPRLGDGLAAHVAVVAGDRVRAEELHLGLLGREVAQAVGDELVVEVAFEVDEEAVVAEVALGGPRLELGDVDRARRELLQDREQRARAVLALEAHDRRLVVTGRRGHAVAHDHEAGLVLGVVLDLAGQDLEAGVGRALAGADRRHALLARLGHLLGRLGGGVGGDRDRVGEVLRHPHAGLAERVGVRHDGRDVGELRALRRAQVQRHRQVDLALHEQLGVERERVEGDGDRALDRVLDGHDADVDLAALDRGDHVRHVAERHRFARGEVGLREQRFLRERAVGPEEPDPSHRREA